MKCVDCDKIAIIGTNYCTNHKPKSVELTANRNTDDANEAYYLISPAILESLARVYAEGREKYGEFNWEKGLPMSGLINRTFRHLKLFLEGDTSEPHLEHALWNLGAAIHSRKYWPHLNKDFLQQLSSRNDRIKNGRA